MKETCKAEQRSFSTRKETLDNRCWKNCYVIGIDKQNSIERRGRREELREESLMKAVVP